MNNPAEPRRHGLHLVAAAPKPQRSPRPEPATQDHNDPQIAEGVRKFQALWTEFDAEMFSPHPDEEHMLELVLEINTLRKRLAAHGVQVQS